MNWAQAQAEQVVTECWPLIGWTHSSTFYNVSLSAVWIEAV